MILETNTSNGLNFNHKMTNKLDTQYQALLQDIIDNGVIKSDRTGTGTISVFGRQIRHKMSEGFPLLTTKKMAFRTMVTELLWFLRGDTNIKYLVDNNCHIWDGDAYKNNYAKLLTKDFHGPWYNQEQFIDLVRTNPAFAKDFGELGPIYGAQWRKWKGDTWVEGNTDGTEGFYLQSEYVDQIANLINDLKTNPDSRRLMVNAWNVGELDQMVLPPCHYGFQVYTRELSLEERFNLYNQDEKLHFEECTMGILDSKNIPTRAISLMWNQRSVDTFLGLPFNIASYGLLLEIIAKEVNMIPDELVGNLGDVHLYSNHIEQAKQQIEREPMELPTINFNTEWWDKPFFEAINNESFCKCLMEEDIQLGNYKSHPAIKAPLSN
jgi:thymidylate synthase